MLVHGAFADAASFARVVPELLADGTRVLVPAVPNRSLIEDAAYIASVIRSVNGPVVLVGHSYGGAVITVAGVEDDLARVLAVSQRPLAAAAFTEKASAAPGRPGTGWGSVATADRTINRSSALSGPSRSSATARWPPLSPLGTRHPSRASSAETLRG